MKLLLTSSGLTNKSIAKALMKLAGKPAKSLKVAFVVTASLYDEDHKDWLVEDLANVVKQGFKQVDILDFAGLPKENWKKRLSNANIIIVGGGSTLYLRHAMKKSGLDRLLPELLKTRVYMGISAGSIVTGPKLLLSGSVSLPLHDEKIQLSRDDKGLGFVDFGFRPHLNSVHFSEVRVAKLQKRAKNIPFSFYAVDDQSAISVDGGKVEIVSEGKWKLFNENL